MYAQMLMLFGGMYVFIGVIVFFMVVISSANTAMMSIFERTREIGTMLAMGTPPRWILALFVTEGVLTGILGVGAGIAAGNLLGPRDQPGAHPLAALRPATPQAGSCRCATCRN